MAGRKGEKHWRDAVMLAVNEVVEGDTNGRKKLRVIADKVTELALDGDMQAIKEIGDRLDGRAPAEVHVNKSDEMNDAEIISRLGEIEASLRSLGVIEGTPGPAGDVEAETRH